MMHVVIDGREYVPALDTGAYKIGIAISTHNRPNELKTALEHHQKYLPAGALLLVIDDGSQIPAIVPPGVALIRHDRAQGVVSAKNACLRALMETGCEELFLWDDDAWPVREGWHKPYIDSPEPHLAYQFLDFATGPYRMKDIAVLHADSRHVAYSGQRGLMLYYNRSVIEKIGGFDWIYEHGMYEHGDLAMRIYHAGLTAWTFADVAGSDKLIYSLDEHNVIKSSIPQAVREQMCARNAEIFNRRRDSCYTGYSPLSRPENIVLTVLLTETVDPQRGIRMAVNPDMLATWAKSIKGARPVVLADNLNKPPEGAVLAKVPAAKESPYFLRWLHIYRWLRDNPQVQWIWTTDGTDVEMLREPWTDMEKGKLYVGSEPSVLSNEWMLKNHPAAYLQDFMKANASLPLLNGGLVGGDRETVMQFVHDMNADWYALKRKRFTGEEKAGSEIGDMATFNYVIRTRWNDQIITGPQVHTVFKSNGIGHDCAWWRHK